MLDQAFIESPRDMADLATGSVGRQIESLFDGSSVAGLTDRQLLERFTSRRDAAAEVAFTALVTRHGPMVLGICRQILGDRHHAEDAFQAVFLVLARRARSIRNPDLLGNMALWGGAAHGPKGERAAQPPTQERGGRRHERFRCGTVVEPMVPPADVSAMAREQAEILHDEIARLPRSFRLPIVLCYFEGLTLAEAAHRLQWPAGTLHSRLARARDKLRRRIARRGLVAPAAALAVGLSHRSASAFVSPALCDSTARAAIQFAAGQAASSLAASLAREVLRAMFANKLRLIATTLLAHCRGRHRRGIFRSLSREPGRAQTAARRSAAAGCGQARRHNPASGPGPDVRRRPRARPTGKTRAQRHDHGLRGDQAAGKRWRGQVEKMKPSAIGQARSDDSGRFQVDAPRTSSSRHRQIGAVAIAPGYGAGWVEFDPDADRPNADISLWPEQVIQGRLFDADRPACSGRGGQGPGHGPRDPGKSGQLLWRRAQVLVEPRERPAGLAQVGDQRLRGPIHHPRRGPGPPGRPHRR